MFFVSACLCGAEISEMSSIPSPDHSCQTPSLRSVLNNMKANSRDCVGESEHEQTCSVCCIICRTHTHTPIFTATIKKSDTELLFIDTLQTHSHNYVK